MKQSKDQQISEVVTGLALGVLATGVVAVSGNKMVLEFAFNHAWRRWAKAAEFPSIRGHDPGNDIWIGMGKSERRRGACAAWSNAAWAEPYITLEDWTVQETLDLHAGDRVPASDWVELARMFIARFRANEVLRADE